MKAARARPVSSAVEYGWVSQRAVDVLALGREQLPKVVSVCEGGRSSEILAAMCGGALVSLEERLGRREVWTSGRIAESLPPWARQRGLPLLSYALDGRVEARARAAGYSPRGAPLRLKHLLDDKRVARRLFALLGAAPPEWVDLSGTPRDHGRLIRRLGSPYVVQPVRGSSGQGVSVVRCADEYEAALTTGKQMIASRWVDGPVMNVHVLVDGCRALSSPWSVQGAGVPGLGGWECAYSGTDFKTASGFGSVIHEQGRRLAVAIGLALGDWGWRGMLGVDAIFDGQALVPLEVNPRLQGSSWLLAEAQLAAGDRPLGSWHRELLLGTADLSTDAHTSEALSGACLVIRATNPGRTVPLADGVHILQAGRLAFQRDTLGLAGCKEDELLLDGIPRVPFAVGAVLARVSSWRALIGSDGRSLTRLGSEVLGAVNAELRTRAPDLDPSQSRSAGPTPRPARQQP